VIPGLMTLFNIVADSLCELISKLFHGLT
jgi:hypothetical protein